jgi:hypothetical protein
LIVPYTHCRTAVTLAPPSVFQLPSVVELNVGGRHFTTSLSTLTKYPGSMLAAMFSGRHDTSSDKDGRHFIDWDADRFVNILKFLRFGEIPSGEENKKSFLRGADYFGLPCKTKIVDKLVDIRRFVSEKPYFSETEFPGILSFISFVIEYAQIQRKTKRVLKPHVHSTLVSRESAVNNPANEHHKCICDRVRAVVTFGPWKAGILEPIFVELIEHFLRQHGFNIRTKRVCVDIGLGSKLCDEEYFNDKGIACQCPRKMYCFELTWPQL